MPILKLAKNCLRLLTVLLALFFSAYCFGGCGGGVAREQGQSEDSTPPADAPWEQITLAKIEGGGMLSPRLRAALDSRSRVHIAYFYDAYGSDYRINYGLLDEQKFHYLQDSELIVDSIDNCAVLAFALTPDNSPVVAYRGGEVRECGTQQQSDVMLSVRQNNAWQEYTGAIGVVERNPVFADGLAGTQASIVTDSQGNIHLAYQFFYEGCDSMNYNYPDLCYVKKDRSDLATESIEETVEGNYYDPQGSLGIQNSVGAHCVITLDSNENPVIFYYAESLDNTRGLRVAHKYNGVWEKEWIEQGCEVGFISCARGKATGCLGVAYYVKRYIPGNAHIHCLRYAEKYPSSSSSWSLQMVDDSTLCGDYCSLAFDASGLAAIAYYEIQSYSGYTLNNLKLAHFNGISWDKEVVSSTGDIGLYNNLLLDEDNHAIICSYSNTDQAIYLFYRNLPF